MDTQGVYLSTDCQQRPYWDDTLAYVHKDFQSELYQTPSSSRSKIPWCISGFDLTHETRPPEHQMSKEVWLVCVWILWLELVHRRFFFFHLEDFLLLISSVSKTEEPLLSLGRFGSSTKPKLMSHYQRTL